MQTSTWDVIIVGGGSAGLSAALMLGRSLRRTLVIDEGRPRNAVAGHMHGVLGRDHTSPLDLLAEGRRELGRYEHVAVEASAVVASAVVTATRTDAASRTDPSGGGSSGAPRFAVELADGTRHLARRLLVASGLRDELPDIPGLAAQWGTGVVVCPYCDGWEHRGRRVAVLAGGPMSTHQAQLMRQLSDDVVYLVSGTELSDASRAALLARGIAVEQREVREVVADDDGRLRGIRFEDGDVREVDVVFAAPAPRPNDTVLRALDAAFEERQGAEWVVLDQMGRTSVPGLFAAGNVTDPRSSVPFAMAGGNFAGAAINADLVEEEIEAAVAAAATAAPAA
ncbi:NAD(P)/FAD-dependent oxidoreductase [Agromyces sp. LHK192]|uniref:NAD(P)/FAD-dependent oxidoreductase n=1 Tax=Agromyces sp. LHK192 TaxID=2498704 RepID=UPI000FD81BC5|nr:NAD(P)/FAD-dependent oxidoreductase [Agromyces sp. LHK192]